MRFNHANFQRGGAAENIFGTRRILHTGQLHHHAVSALLLNNRFGNTQFVDTVTQRQNVLLQRVFLRAFDCFFFKFAGDPKLAAVLLRAQLQIGHVFFDFGDALVTRRFVAKAHHHGIFVTRHAGMLNTRVAQAGADVVNRGVDFFVERGLHVHLQQKMHAAAQIQSQIHRQRADRRQPIGAARQQVKRHHVIFAQLRLQ